MKENRKKVEREDGGGRMDEKVFAYDPQHHHVVMNMRTVIHWNCVPTVTQCILQLHVSTCMKIQCN